jgi:hypothetical protein
LASAEIISLAVAAASAGHRKGVKGTKAHRQCDRHRQTVGLPKRIVNAANRRYSRPSKPAPVKPSALRIERLLAKVEAESRARPRRYFHFDEVAEAEAQGLPYVLVPRELSPEEWEKKYCTAGAGEPEKK